MCPKKPGHVSIAGGFADQPHEEHTAQEVAHVPQGDTPEEPSPIDSAVENPNQSNVHIRRNKGHAADYDNHQGKHKHKPHQQIGQTRRQFFGHAGAHCQGQCCTENDHGSPGKP